MPWTPPITPVAGTVITVPWADSSVVNPINWLRAMTGGADPAGSNLALYATGPSATAWGKLPDDVHVNPKVNRNATLFSSFAAAASYQSAFCWINTPGSIPDAPIPTHLDWYLMQVTHPTNFATHRWQFTCSLSNQDEIYSRNVIGGTVGPWRKVLTSANFDPLTFDGGTLVRDDVAGNQFQIWANGGHIALYNEDASVLMADITPTATVAPRFTSTATTGPPFSVASAAMVPNLNAERLGGSTLAEVIAAARVPSGLIAAFPNAAAIASGWSRFTSGNGRFLVGAGTVAGQTFVEGASAGSTWAHLHGVSLSAAAVSGGNVQGGGSSTANTADHTHPVAGNTADATWIPPSFTVVWAQKS